MSPTGSNTAATEATLPSKRDAPPRVFITTSVIGHDYQIVSAPRLQVPWRQGPWLTTEPQHPEQALDEYSQRMYTERGWIRKGEGTPRVAPKSTRPSSARPSGSCNVPPSSPGSSPSRPKCAARRRVATRASTSPRPPATRGRVCTKQPRRAGRGDAKVTPERRAGPRGAPAPTNSPSPRGRYGRAHAPRRPSAAPSLEKSGGGYLGFCACRKEPKRAQDSVGEPVRRLPPPTQAEPAARVPTHDRLPAGPPPPPAQPTPGLAPRALPRAGCAWHPRPREASPSESQREWSPPCLAASGLRTPQTCCRRHHYGQVPSAPGERQTGGETPASRAEPPRECGEGGCSGARRRAGRPGLQEFLWPTEVFFGRVTGNHSPGSIALFLAHLSSFLLSCLGPPPVWASGRAAPQSSLRFSDSGNGPAAEGEGEAGADPVTGNASGPSRPAPCARVQLASFSCALKTPSKCVLALGCSPGSVFPTSSSPPAPGKKWPPWVVPAPRRGKEGQDPRVRANPWSICRDKRRWKV